MSTIPQSMSCVLGKFAETHSPESAEDLLSAASKIEFLTWGQQKVSLLEYVRRRLRRERVVWVECLFRQTKDLEQLARVVCMEIGYAWPDFDPEKCGNSVAGFVAFFFNDPRSVWVRQLELKRPSYEDLAVGVLDSRGCPKNLPIGHLLRDALPNTVLEEIKRKFQERGGREAGKYMKDQLNDAARRNDPAAAALLRGWYGGWTLHYDRPDEADGGGGGDSAVLAKLVGDAVGDPDPEERLFQDEQTPLRMVEPLVVAFWVRWLKGSQIESLTKISVEGHDVDEFWVQRVLQDSLLVAARRAIGADLAEWTRWRGLLGGELTTVFQTWVRIWSECTDWRDQGRPWQRRKQLLQDLQTALGKEFGADLPSLFLEWHLKALPRCDRAPTLRSPDRFASAAQQAAGQQ
jgi:hypothetical protein